jgi:MFS family permease
MAPSCLGLPLDQVLACGATFGSTYLLTNVFSYVGLLIVHLCGGTREEAGYRAGLLVSAFMIPRIFTSALWGYVADRYGRRPVLLIGCYTMFAFQLMFGLSGSFGLALASRTLVGLFSGVVGTSKTLASELAGSSPGEQASAMNIYSVASTLGTILGPAISGVLYDPAAQWPDSVLARWPLARDYPAFLPNLVSALFSLAAGLGILFYVPETLPGARPLPWFVPALVARALGGVPRASAAVAVAPGLEPEQQRLAQQPEQRPERHAPEQQQPDQQPEQQQSEQQQSKRQQPGQQQPQQPPQLLLLQQPGQPDRPAQPGQPPQQSFLSAMRQLWAVRKVRISIMVYSYYSFISIAYSEVFGLWLLSNPAVGGFGFDSTRIGVAVSASAALMLVFQLAVFPRVKSLCPPVQYTVLLLWLSVGYYVQLPLSALAPADQLALSMTLLVMQRAVQNVLNNTTFIFLNVLTNNACPVDSRATVNGMVMGMGSVYKALGPIAAGSLYAWSVTNGIRSFPLNYWLVFILLSALSGLLAVYAHRLPLELNVQHSSSKPLVLPGASSSSSSTTNATQARVAPS